MSELFRTKVRNVGSSLVVSIPKKILVKNSIDVGDLVQLSLLKRRKLSSIIKRINLP